MIANVMLPTQPNRCVSRLQPQLKLQISKHVRLRVNVRIPAEAHRQLHRQLHRSTTEAAGSTYTSDARTQQAVDAAQLNEISNQALVIMLANRTRETEQLEAGLRDMRCQLAEEAQQQGMQYISVLQGLLQHTVIKEADKLEGMYKQAFDRIINQVAGSDWKLVQEGQSAEANQEPQFSTWEEVVNKKKAQKSNEASQSSSDSQSASAQASASSSNPASTGSRRGRVFDDTYYSTATSQLILLRRLVGVPVDASQADIKSAYRKAALKLHPDVNNAADATEKFAQLSSAYDTLSEPQSRRLYDEYGPEGMQRHQGAASGRGNAQSAWDEFKPFKKENKHTKARDSARASASGEGAATDDISFREAVMGDVVEYPLSAVVKQELQDGRSHGVGLLVGRNKDRGDVKTLPEEAVGLCEIEPLRQEEAGSNKWIPDELGVPSFAQLHDLKTVPVTEFNAAFDIWQIHAALSAGCGGPDLPEEIML